MSTKERDHLGVCVRIKAGGLRLREGSEQLRLGYPIDVGPGSEALNAPRPAFGRVKPDPHEMLRVYRRFVREGPAPL